MNLVAICGRLTRDPEIRYGGKDNATAIARFTLAVDDMGDTDFISCKALGRAAEWVEKWAHKGTKIEVKGRIKSGSYEKNGSKVYYTEVLADAASFGESKAEADARAAAGNNSQQEPAESDGFMNIPDGVDEELPFK